MFTLNVAEFYLFKHLAFLIFLYLGYSLHILKFIFSLYQIHLSLKHQLPLFLTLSLTEHRIFLLPLLLNIINPAELPDLHLLPHLQRVSLLFFQLLAFEFNFPFILFLQFLLPFLSDALLLSDLLFALLFLGYILFYHFLDFFLFLLGTQLDVVTLFLTRCFKLTLFLVYLHGTLFKLFSLLLEHLLSLLPRLFNLLLCLLPLLRRNPLSLILLLEHKVSPLLVPLLQLLLPLVDSFLLLTEDFLCLHSEFFLLFSAFFFFLNSFLFPLEFH